MKKFRDLILNSINEEITGSQAERIAKVKAQFEIEMLWQGKRQPSIAIIQDWLQGLCHSVQIPWENYTIIEWYESCHNRKIIEGLAVKGNARYETLLNNYWPRCANALYKLMYE